MRRSNAFAGTTTGVASQLSCNTAILTDTGISHITTAYYCCCCCCWAVAVTGSDRQFSIHCIVQRHTAIVSDESKYEYPSVRPSVRSLIRLFI